MASTVQTPRQGTGLSVALPPAGRAMLARGLARAVFSVVIGGWDMAVSANKTGCGVPVHKGHMKQDELLIQYYLNSI